MTDQSFFHMNVLRSPYQMANFGYPGPFMDMRVKEGEIPGLEGMSSTNTRILEIRKEKSRDAARSRRGKENYEFYELAKMLPLPAAITSQLDKASIIRLSISYLKLRDFSSHGDPPWNREGPPPNKSIKREIQGGPPRRRNLTAVAMDIFESHQGTHILQSLDGFGFALSNDGRFLYISETVSIYLGLSQVEMTGSSVFDYVHVQDHPELAEHLGLSIPQGGVPSPGSLSDDGSTGETARSVSPPMPDKASLMNPSTTKGPDRSFCIRMKSTLTKRGVHVKTSGYRVVYVIAHHRPQFSFSLNRKHTPPLLGMVALAIALPPPTITELRMESDTFVMRLSPEFKVLYCEPKITELLDLNPDDLTNNILYDHCHAADLQKLRKSHIDLLGKGQVITEYYRMMNKHGGYVWVQTFATTLCTAKNLEEQNVVAVNYVLSGVEYGGCVMDCAQLQSVPHREPDQSDHSDHSNIGSDQESDHQKNDKETQKTREAKKMRESGATQFGTVSKNPQHSPGNNSHLPEGNTAERNLVCISPVERVNKVPMARYSPQPARVPNLDNDSVFHERTDCSKSDGKNSRRKMDRPRKRKREVENEYEINGIDHYDEDLLTQSRANIVSTGGHPNMCSQTADHPTLASTLSASPQHDLVGPIVVSPVPEDLSMKTSTPSPLIVPSSLVITRPVAVDISRQNSVSSLSEAEWSKPGAEDKVDAITTSSVKDLEEAMNKHLPVLPDRSPEPRISVSDSISDNHTADGSCLHAKQKSTIQWIGSQQPPVDPLAASNLLRSLYANRESVIRTNICNTRPHYYGEQVAVNMLTPPGTDGYKEPATLSLHHPLQHQPGKQATSNLLHSSISSYSSTPITVAMTTHMADSSYNMTPPSSVSPQDKFVSPFTDGTFTNGMSSHCSSTEDPCQRLPIKPQLYSVPMPAHLPSYTDRSSSLSYPSISTYNSTGAGFPAYSTAANVGAEHNSAWYATHFATP